MKFLENSFHIATCVAMTPVAAANAAMMSDPPTPAAVPSKLTAPSVPGGTGLSVVIRNVRFPYALNCGNIGKEITQQTMKSKKRQEK